MPRKKILVVSYYWFPNQGTGVYRISKFIKFLMRSGWEVIVLTAAKESENPAKEDPQYKEVKVYRTREMNPVKWFFRSHSGAGPAINPSVFYGRNRSLKTRILAWIRLNLFVPDAKIGWKYYAVKEGLKIIKQENPSLILSTCPPPTAHLVAKEIAERSKLPWVADFRDPWTKIFYYEEHPLNKIAAAYNLKLERSVLNSANRIVVVNDGFFAQEPKHSAPVKIPNGFDTDDLPASIPETINYRFTIRYLGTLKMNQYSEGLIEAIHNIERKYPEVAGKLTIEFYGNTDPAYQHDLISGVKKMEIGFRGFVPHKTAIAQAQSANMLMLIIGRNSRSKLVLSTKIFEYLMMKKPVLGIGPIDGSACQLLEETKTGKMFTHQDSSGIEDYILAHFRAWESKSDFIETNVEAIDRYNFKNLTATLESVLLNVMQ